MLCSVFQKDLNSSLDAPSRLKGIETQPPNVITKIAISLDAPSRLKGIETEFKIIKPTSNLLVGLFMVDFRIN